MASAASVPSRPATGPRLHSHRDDCGCIERSQTSARTDQSKATGPSSQYGRRNRAGRAFLAARYSLNRCPTPARAARDRGRRLNARHEPHRLRLEDAHASERARLSSIRAYRARSAAVVEQPGVARDPAHVPGGGIMHDAAIGHAVHHLGRRDAGQLGLGRQVAAVRHLQRLIDLAATKTSSGVWPTR